MLSPHQKIRKFYLQTKLVNQQTLIKENSQTKPQKLKLPNPNSLSATSLLNPKQNPLITQTQPPNPTPDSPTKISK
jgi:hypothetical protein